MPRSSVHRERLLQTAIRLFRQRGFAATGLAEILAGSGAPRGSLYHYFPGGKAQLGAEAVEAAGAAVTATLEGLRSRTAGADAFAEAYVALLVRSVEASGFRDGCPIATVLLETAADEPAIATAGRRAFEAWCAVIASVYERDGVERQQAAERAMQFVALVEGALLLARVQGSAEPLRRIARGASAAALA